jgi:hypothetical protein
MLVPALRVITPVLMPTSLVWKKYKNMKGKLIAGLPKKTGFRRIQNGGEL